MRQQTNDEVALKTIRKEGVALIPPLTSNDADAFSSHLMQCTVYNAHVKAKSTANCAWVSTRENRWPMFCHDMVDVVRAPAFFEAALETYQIAANYFQEQPLLYSMNAFWTQPSGEVYQDTHNWHRDGDDRKQLVMFMFGTDVLTYGDGEHCYQRGTQNIADNALGRDFREPPATGVTFITGRSGTRFLADTGGLHYGARPNKLRMLAWARWGVSDPPQSYIWDQLSPVPRDCLGARYPADPAMREAIKLVVN